MAGPANHVWFPGGYPSEWSINVEIVVFLILRCSYFLQQPWRDAEKRRTKMVAFFSRVNMFYSIFQYSKYLFMINLLQVGYHPKIGWGDSLVEFLYFAVPSSIHTGLVILGFRLEIAGFSLGNSPHWLRLVGRSMCLEDLSLKLKRQLMSCWDGTNKVGSNIITSVWFILNRWMIMTCRRTYWETHKVYI